jgi:hypothetical protein
MSGELIEPVMLRGRTFTHGELLQIRAVVEEAPDAHRFALSKKVCEVLNWRQANGRLKDRSCRDVLLKLEAAGIIVLPHRRRPPTRRQPITITAKTDPKPDATFSPRDITARDFTIVTGSGRLADEKLWNEYVERYHYLGYGVPVGPHIKYFVRFHQEPVACIAFAGAAWKVAPRDSWIGWTAEQRQCNLRWIVNNTRFLILPWIRIGNLASRLLSLALKRLPDDWMRLYAYCPLLVETFVHADRHAGTCYRAANWLCVGTTQGRGKNDRKNIAGLPKKLVFLREVAAGARDILAAASGNHDP